MKSHKIAVIAGDAVIKALGEIASKM